MKKRIERVSDSPAATKKIGWLLGKYLRSGDVVALQGPLGSGKTTLVQGIARGLGVRSEKSVASPTYVLIHEYKGRERIYHLDWYRLKVVIGPDAELAQECFSSGITLVEWPERGKKVLPKDALHIRISHVSPKKRRLSFSFHNEPDPGLMEALKKR